MILFRPGTAGENSRQRVWMMKVGYEVRMQNKSIQSKSTHNAERSYYCLGSLFCIRHSAAQHDR